jgi:hypothetical protein
VDHSQGPTTRKAKAASGGSHQIPRHPMCERAAVDHRNRFEASVVVERDRGSARKRAVGDALGGAREAHAAGRAPTVETWPVPRRALSRHAAHDLSPSRGVHLRARRQSELCLQATELGSGCLVERAPVPARRSGLGRHTGTAGPTLRGGRSHQDQEDSQPNCPSRDPVGTGARQRAVFSSPRGTRATRGISVRPWPAVSPVQQPPLFLAPTGLADGLALKELRYAGKRRFAPAALAGPHWFPRSPGAYGARAEIQRSGSCLASSGCSVQD